MHILVFGGKGYIGKELCAILEAKEGVRVTYAESRADDRVAVEREIQSTQPDRVVSLVGRTFGPGFNSIDYLEQPGKLVDNLRDNLYAPMVLALVCDKYNIHLTYVGTGCIFDYLKDHEDSSDSFFRGFSEDAQPNFFGSSYSTVKGYTDQLMHMFDNVLNIRIRMPVFADAGPRDFISKLVSYKQICSQPNSITVLPDLLPVLVTLMEKKQTGTVNLVNAGVVSHNEVLELYKDIVDPSHTWQNISTEEHDALLLSKRSNNRLDTTTLETLFPGQVPSAKDSLRAVLQKRCETSSP